jgi:hypothetical protein
MDGFFQTKMNTLSLCLINTLQIMMAKEFISMITKLDA